MEIGAAIVGLGWGCFVLLPVIVAQQLWIYWNARRSAKREELFRMITENAADMIALVSVKGRRLYNSPAHHKVLGNTAAELARTPAFEQIHPEDRAKVLEASRQARETGVGKTLQYRLRHKDGSWRVLESTANTIRNAKGQIEKLVIVNRDITEKKRAENKLAHDALHDSLLNIPNRRLLLDRLERCFQQAQRDPNFRYAVLLIDIDNFKACSESLGPALADQALIEISRRVQQHVARGRYRSSSRWRGYRRRRAAFPVGWRRVHRAAGGQFGPKRCLAPAGRGVDSPALRRCGSCRCSQDRPFPDPDDAHRSRQPRCPRDDPGAWQQMGTRSLSAGCRETANLRGSQESRVASSDKGSSSRRP